MKKMAKYPIFVILALLAVSGSATQLGAGPAKIVFNDMMAGQNWYEIITINSPGDDTLTVSISISGIPEGWITLDSDGKTITMDDEFLLQSNQPKKIRASIRLPEDANTGVYTGKILIKSKPVEGGEQGISMQVGLNLNLDVIVNVTNTPNPSAKGTYIVAYNIKPEDQLLIEYTFENTGNVEVIPRLEYEIMSDEGTQVKNGTIEFTLPKIRGPQTFSEKIGLDDVQLGKYLFDIKAFIDDENIYDESTQFYIYEEVTTVTTSLPASTIEPAHITIPAKPGKPGNIILLLILVAAIVGAVFLSRKKK